MTERPSAERIAFWRQAHTEDHGNSPDCPVCMLLNELDAVTRELDEAAKNVEERGQMLFDEQMARQRAERERDEANETATNWMTNARDLSKANKTHDGAE